MSWARMLFSKCQHSDFLSSFKKKKICSVISWIVQFDRSRMGSDALSYQRTWSSSLSETSIFYWMKNFISHSTTKRPTRFWTSQSSLSILLLRLDLQEKLARTVTISAFHRGEAGETATKLERNGKKSAPPGERWQSVRSVCHNFCLRGIFQVSQSRIWSRQTP